MATAHEAADKRSKAQRIVDAAPTENDAMQVALDKYFMYGYNHHGHFLSALLANDFVEACTRADSTNKDLLHEWAIWLYNDVPANAWGSDEIADAYEGV